MFSSSGDKYVTDNCLSCRFHSDIEETKFCHNTGSACFVFTHSIVNDDQCRFLIKAAYLKLLAIEVFWEMIFLLLREDCVETEPVFFTNSTMLCFIINFQTHLEAGIDNWKDVKLSALIIPDDKR